MNEQDVRKRAFAMPLTSPAYPCGPYRFVDREFFVITYRTDPAKLKEVVPAPLKIDPAEPFVKYEFIRMPDSTGFGDYTETGQVKVDNIVAAHDCGKALNPLAVHGQVIGSVYMGLGQALQEEMVWKDGLLMNPGLLEYRSPSSTESPEVECIIVESVDPEGPFGAKEASEGSLAAAIPAVANAIYDAVGIRLRESPFTPERVLAALRAKQPGAKKIQLSGKVDPTNPDTFREHGGSLSYRGRGAVRHALDPAVRRKGASGSESEPEQGAS